MSGVRIFGIGSPSGDDQAGWLAVDALLATNLVDVQIEKMDRPGSNLISLMENASRVILIDGRDLGRLMVDYGVGVTTTQTLRVTEVDENFVDGE